jgi:hypothetical protein
MLRHFKCDFLKSANLEHKPFSNVLHVFLVFRVQSRKGILTHTSVDMRFDINTFHFSSAVFSWTYSG